MWCWVVRGKFRYFMVLAAIALAAAALLALAPAPPTTPKGVIYKEIEPIGLALDMSGNLAVEISPSDNVKILDPFGQTYMNTFDIWYLPWKYVGLYYGNFFLYPLLTSGTIQESVALIEEGNYYVVSVKFVATSSTTNLDLEIRNSDSPGTVEYSAGFSGLTPGVLYRAKIRFPYQQATTTTWEGVTCTVYYSPVPPVKLNTPFYYIYARFSLWAVAVLNDGSEVILMDFESTIIERTTDFLTFKSRITVPTALSGVKELKLLAAPASSFSGSLVNDMTQYEVMKAVFASPVNLPEGFILQVTYRLYAGT